MLSAGNLISGRYRLVRLLGEGGMGTVWAAVNEAFGRNVAVKVMLRHVAADPTALERFLTEARICGAIRHPGIVDVLDVGKTEDGSPFLVMEMLEGEPLDAIVRRTGTIRPLDILPVVRDVARTIALAHERGVIHRDIKPANIFLHRLPNGQIVAKVLDFGISKVAKRESAPTMTQADTVVGSPAYMSPEQAAGRVEIDARSDVYGLGVILYEALSGRLPFLETNYNALIIDVAVKEPPPLVSVSSGLPKQVLELVAAAMAHDREQRIESANALADRIEATLVALGASATLALPDPASLGRGSAPSPVGARSAASHRAVVKTRRRSHLAALALGVIGAVVVGGGVIAWKLMPESASPLAAASATVPASTSAAPVSPPAPPSAPPALAPTSAAPAETVAATATAAPTTAPSSAPGASARKGTAGKKKEKEKGGAYGFD